MAIDPAVVDAVNTQLLQASGSGFIRRSERADEISGQALEDVRAVASRQREDFHLFSNLVMNRITSDQTGTDDVASERILTARSVQAQPEEQTFNDPNYRPGAAPPTAPPSPTKSS